MSIVRPQMLFCRQNYFADCQWDMKSTLLETWFDQLWLLSSPAKSVIVMRDNKT